MTDTNRSHHRNHPVKRVTNSDPRVSHDPHPATESGVSADHLCYQHAAHRPRGQFIDGDNHLFQLDEHECKKCGTPVKVVYRRDCVVIDGHAQHPDEFDHRRFQPLGTAVAIVDEATQNGPEALFFDVPSPPRDHPLGNRRVLLRYSYDATIVGEIAIDEQDGRQVRYIVNDAPNESLDYVDDSQTSATDEQESTHRRQNQSTSGGVSEGEEKGDSATRNDSADQSGSDSEPLTSEEEELFDADLGE